jgi:hypothetical protein
LSNLGSHQQELALCRYAVGAKPSLESVRRSKERGRESHPKEHNITERGSS